MAPEVKPKPKPKVRQRKYILVENIPNLLFKDHNGTYFRLEERQRGHFLLIEER